MVFRVFQVSRNPETSKLENLLIVMYSIVNNLGKVFNLSNNNPTIKKSWVSHALFWTSAPVFEVGACRDLALALTLFLRRFYGRPHLLLFSSTGGRDATTVSFFLCLAAGSRLTQTQTWRPQMTCGLAFLSAIVMSFFSPTNNLRRSTRIHDASYRPRTTWRLPEIVSVASPLFFWSLR